jgi:hypothetical protein
VAIYNEEKKDVVHQNHLRYREGFSYVSRRMPPKNFISFGMTK